MSEKVQFIFITHNKVTMEAANQLMGVTMHEPGTSRLVSVDVNEAVELAKDFGATDSYKYVNSILDELAKIARKAEKEA